MRLNAKLRLSGLYVTGFFFVAALSVALPMSFEFRQLVSIKGVTIVEMLLGALLLLLVAYRPQALFPRGYRNICTLLYLFLLWALVRGLIGVMEGNELERALRGLRHYLPLLTLPILLYLINVWQPNPTAVAAKLTTYLAVAHFVYMMFLVAVILSPALSDLLMMKAFLYRIASNTMVISMTLLLLVCLLWSEGNVRTGIIGIVIVSVGVTLLLAQSRVGTVMLVLLIGLGVGLYTVRTARMRFVGIGFSMVLAVIIALSAGFLWLNSTIPDFEKFVDLFLRRIETQEGADLWESITTHSLGTEAFRTRVVDDASSRPAIGFGEGKGIGPTMSQEDGGYIDSTVLTMWYKNGMVGVLLYYAFWLAILGRLVKGYLRYRSRFKAGIASIATASVFVWLLWSSANAFLMYGWVLYPVMAIVAVSLFILQNDKSLDQACRGIDAPGSPESGRFE